MRLLLDAHIFLWYIAADPRLPESSAIAIREPDHEMYLSVVSIRDAVIKHALGKLPSPAPPAAYLPLARDAHRITALPVDEGAIAPLAGLPTFHRDPFDRMLVAQAIQHGLTIVTVDAAMAAYPVPQLATV